MWSFLILLSSGILIGLCTAEEIRLLLKVLEDCSAPGSEPATCLKTKLVTALDRAARSTDLELTEGVHLIGPGSTGPILTEKEIEAGLPRSLADRERVLDSLILDKIMAFFQGHSIQFKLAEIPRSLGVEEEGRGKKKKTLNTLLLLLFMMAGTFIPLKLGTLAMLAGKALIISKLALTLAGIVGLKKLLHSDHHDESYQVVQVPHSHRRRSISDLPYRAYKHI